jgi:uncharacterized membrane protein (DUF4010 family)
MSVEYTSLFYRFGVAIAIGFLIGMQREFALGRTRRRLPAGVRTFSLYGLSGCVAAMVADQFEVSLIFAAIMVVLGALVVFGYYSSMSKKRVGATTEVAAIVTILLGALCYLGYLILAVATAVAITVILSLKIEMHTFARNIRGEDVYATLKLAVISAIVLPLLPNQNYGLPPLDVINPFSIWLMVVFISAISFAGYLLIKLLGPGLGIGLTGLLGGLVSSTAVTLGFTQRSHEEEQFSKSFALGIILSWTVMYLRIGVILIAVNIALLQSIWLPLMILILVGAIYSLILYLSQSNQNVELLRFSNPFSLGPALKFGVLYAVILFGAKAGQVYLGDAGVYLSSLLAGLVDLSAITLSLARLSSIGQELDLQIAGRGIIFASMANTVVKGAIVMVSGSGMLRRVVFPGLGVLMASSLAVAFWLL